MVGRKRAGVNLAKLGSIYLGGNELPELAPEHIPSGIAFPLKDKSETSQIWHLDDSKWQVELKQGHTHIVARSRESMDYQNLVTRGLEEIQRRLDIIAVKKIGVFNLDAPKLNHIAVFQRNGNCVLRHFAVSSLGVAFRVSVEVRDKDGNIRPTNPISEPKWTRAFRYYRLSQASQDIFEAYRNLFLSLEALLNEIYPKRSSESEKKWLKGALVNVSSKVDFSRHVPSSIDQTPIDYIIETQYTNIRCQIFHAKFPGALLPHAELNPVDVLFAYEALVRLWHDIGEVYFNVPRGGAAMTYQGFKLSMDGAFSKPLSMYFTEDDTPQREEDTNVSPLGPAIFPFTRAWYLSQTQPGVVSWQGEVIPLDVHKTLRIHRIGTKLNDALIHTASIRDGLTPAGVGVFETYQSIRLLNESLPKTIF